MNQFKANMGHVRSWLLSDASHRFLMVMLLIMLFFSTVSPVSGEEKLPKDPISVEQIKGEFTAAKSENRPVKIEGRLIEGSALEYLNDNLSEGPGITLSMCEINGDLNFVKHTRSVDELKGMLDQKLLERLSTIDGILVRVELVRQAISVLKSEIHGSLVGYAFQQGGVNFKREADLAIFEQPVVFSDTAAERAIFSQAIFRKPASFYKAKFSGDADFAGAKFSGKASFKEATFSGGWANFSATFSDEADFANATFSAWSNFSATFTGPAIFYSATFSGHADFLLATFKGLAGFDKATFSGGASFYQAKFTSEASFVWATFSGMTNFSSTKFSGAIMARSVQFGDSVSFQDALFDRDVNFTGSDFAGPTNFSRTRFLAGDLVKEPVHFVLCTFRRKADFTNALFQRPALFNSCVIEDELCFNNLRSNGDFNLSGIRLGGVLSLVAMKCGDIFFGVSRQSAYDLDGERETPAILRAKMALDEPLSDDLETGCSIELTGAYYSRLLFLDWGKLEPAIEEGLKRNGLASQTAGDNTPEEKNDLATQANWQQKSDGRTQAGDPEAHRKEQRNATLAALRLLAKNYEAVGSESDAQKAYAFDRNKRLEFQPTFIDRIIWVTTGFGAHNGWLAYWFLGLWIVPWALGYWRPGVIVSADPKSEAPDDSLWNWVSALAEDPSLRQLHMIGFSLWFSFHTLVPGIQVFGFDKWAPSHQKICEVIPVRYTSVATVQRILGWVLLPIAIATFAGLFRIK